jgi:hypothetical protein
MKRSSIRLKFQILIAFILLILFVLSVQPCLAGLIWSG